MTAPQPTRAERVQAAVDLLLDQADQLDARADEVPLSWLDDTGLLSVLHAATTLAALAQRMTALANDRVRILHRVGFVLGDPDLGRVEVNPPPAGSERHDLGLVLTTIAAQTYKTDAVELPAAARALVRRVESVLLPSTKLSLPNVRKLGLTDADVVTTYASDKPATITYTPPKETPA